MIMMTTRSSRRRSQDACTAPQQPTARASCRDWRGAYRSSNAALRVLDFQPTVEDVTKDRDRSNDAVDGDVQTIRASTERGAPRFPP